jgi:AcrR family transcriptional regulator
LNPETNLSPVKQQRQSKILDAALLLFTRQGYRATTIEGIAEAAAMSKVTIYGYFADKDEIFRAVGQRLANSLQQAVKDQLSRSGTIVDQVAAALAAKHRMVFESVRGSPFSAELFQMNALLMKDIFAKADEQIIGDLADQITSAGTHKSEAERKAALLFHASQGVANGAMSADRAEADIKMLVAAVLNTTG